MKKDLKKEEALAEIQETLQHYKYIAHFDILGFKNIINKNKLNDVKDKIYPIIEKGIKELKDGSNEGIKHFWEKSNFDKIVKPEIFAVWFSDTIIFYTNIHSDYALFNLLLFSNKFFARLFKEGIPLRGAIVDGPLYVDDKKIEYMIGKSLVDAYELEKIQNWSGAIIQIGLSEKYYTPTNEAIGALIHLQEVAEYHVPLKCGKVKEYYCLNWVNSFNELGESNSSFTDLMCKFSDKELDWPIKEKITNTENFYMKLSQSI